MYQESYDTLQQVAGGLKALAIVFQELEEAGKALSHLADLVEQVIEAETEDEDTDENGGDGECDGACSCCPDPCPVVHYEDSLHATIEVGQHRIEIRDDLGKGSNE